MRHHMLPVALCAALANLLAASVSAQAQGPLWTFRDQTAPSDNQLGFHVAMVGDYNFDSVNDVLLGAPGDIGTQLGFTNGGAAWVRDGATGANLATYYGAAQDLRLGSHGIGVANTVQGPVLVIGAPGSPPSAPSDGAVLIYPFNAPGAIPTVISKPWDSNNNPDGFGSEIAAIGDYDGDGFDDFAVGAPNGNPLGEGYVEVISGVDLSTILYYVYIFKPTAYTLTNRLASL